MPVGTAKYKETEGRLPKELQPVFRRFVQEYEFLTQLKYGKGYVAYEVLAELVLAGWRPSDKPHPSSAMAE